MNARLSDWLLFGSQAEKWFMLLSTLALLVGFELLWTFAWLLVVLAWIGTFALVMIGIRVTTHFVRALTNHDVVSGLIFGIPSIAFWGLVAIGQASQDPQIHLHLFWESYPVQTLQMAFVLAMIPISVSAALWYLFGRAVVSAA
jgi:hypothetical protein